MWTVGLPNGDDAVPPLGELLVDEVLAPVADTLLDVPPLLVVDAALLVVPAAPLPPNTAVPVSSKRLCGGVGAVSAAPLALAVEVELADVVAGAHDAPVPAPLVVLPAPVLVVKELVPRALLVPARAAATVLTELVPVLTVTVPVDVVPPLAVLAWLLEAELLLPAVVDPWQAARPTETTTAGTMVR